MSAQAYMNAIPETTATIPDPAYPLTKEQLDTLISMSMLGRNITFKYKHKPGRYTVGLVEDEVYIIIGEYKHLIQKVRFQDGVSWDGSTHAYRTGYYTYAAGRKTIKWGQYTQFLTEKEYRLLLQKARDKGWQLT
jgi:hypothetical protein